MKSTLLTVLAGILLITGYYFGKRYFLKPDIKQGVTAARIEGELMDGTRFSLTELQGKYVLLDFWGSWCKPCRETNPQLVKLHQRFGNEKYMDADGFEIVSYAFDRSAAAWLAAIQKDSLYWKYHLLATNMFDSQVANDYNVKQIPTKFLINPEGIIVAVDPSISTLSGLLEKKIDTTKGSPTGD